jgi:predicted small lipoprotein YifL
MPKRLFAFGGPMRFVYLSLLLAVLLQGCGIKGALYLPKEPPPQQQDKDKK